MKNKIPQWNRVEIEIQSFCNRKCSFCPRYYDRTGIRKDENGKPVKKKMPSEKVYAIIDWLFDYGYKGIIRFHRLSEPLIDKRYKDFAKYAFSKGMKIKEHTNGDILRKNKELCEELDGCIDTLTIGLYNYKNYKQKQEQIKFWNKRFNKTKIKFSLPLEYTNIRQNSKIYNKQKKNDQILAEPCPQNRLKVFLIRYDGEVSLCCQDDGCEFKLGNVFTNSISDIWYSNKHTEIFNKLLKPNSRKKYKLCSSCYITSSYKSTRYGRIKNRGLLYLWRRNLINVKILNKYSQ